MKKMTFAEDEPEQSEGDQEVAAFRILLFGIDTVYLSFGQEVTQAMYERLLAEKEQARLVRKERNAVYCSEWLDAQVYPTGTNSGFQVLIGKAGVWSIKMQKGNEQCPGVYLGMRSAAVYPTLTSEVAPYMDGDVCTRYEFGRKRIMARIHNKSAGTL